MRKTLTLISSLIVREMRDALRLEIQHLSDRIKGHTVEKHIYVPDFQADLPSEFSLSYDLSQKVMQAQLEAYNRVMEEERLLIEKEYKELNDYTGVL